MCSIFGSNFIPQNKNQIANILALRGPDSQKEFIYDNFFMSHARLAIIDLNIEATQPMGFENITIIFNGEIYNYKELKKEFDLNCSTSSDTEVILQLYKKFGEKCLQYLDGIFAFAIFDKETKKIFCARDRFGKKPFYYYFKDGKFIFSSSTKAIIKALNFTPNMNTNAVSEYLQFFVPLTPNTFFENIFKLPAASQLIFENNEVKVKKYFHIKRKKTIFEISDAILETEKSLFEAVSKRLISDSPIGALLSGGLDSSLVGAIYSKISDQKIDFFSVGYEGYEKYDETNYAKNVSNFLGGNHNILRLSQQSFEDSLENYLDILEEPHADSSAVALNALLKITKSQNKKVLLSGEGSDELFFGYPTVPKLYKFWQFFNSLDSNQRQFLLLSLKSFENKSKEFEYFRRFLNNENFYNSYGEIFNYSLKSQLLIKHKPIMLQNEITEPLDKMAMIDFTIWLGEALLSKIDFIGMNNHTEIRAPFLDTNVVNTAFSIDAKIRFKNHPKNIIKLIATNYLPSEIILRKKKAFNLPYNEWLHNIFGDKILELILEVNKHHNLFKKSFLIELFEASRNNNFRQHIWTLYIFSRWYKKIYL
jgi:asparagine synthase (glutamine-hydrolysing)